MSASGGKKAILAALAANAGIAVAKFVGYVLTGSASMLAEAVHSVADTSNQALLLVGQSKAEKHADAVHPFGYGRSRYFYSFVVALVLFTLGSLFAIYEGLHKIQEPEPLNSPIIAIALLAVAIALETFSFITAVKESRVVKGNATWWSFLRNAKTPELPVVLLEDAGALIGLVLALFGVGMSILTGNPVWDGIGTILIGALLGVIALFLIVEMQSLLIGEGVTSEDELRITTALVDGVRIDRVIHMRTLYLGPDEVLVAAKIGIVPGASIEEIARAIDEAEQRVRATLPVARRVYLEPDLYREAQAS